MRWWGCRRRLDIGKSSWSPRIERGGLEYGGREGAEGLRREKGKGTDAGKGKMG